MFYVLFILPSLHQYSIMAQLYGDNIQPVISKDLKTYKIRQLESLTLLISKHQQIYYIEAIFEIQGSRESAKPFTSSR